MKLSGIRLLMPRGAPWARFKLAVAFVNQYPASSERGSPCIDEYYSGEGGARTVHYALSMVIQGGIKSSSPWINELESGFPTSINLPFTSLHPPDA